MKNILIRRATKDDFAAIVEINQAEVIYTSPMDDQRLELLDSLAAYHSVCVYEEQVVGFLIAIKSGTPFENDNFKWFSARYDNFLYIDRAVIRPGYQGRKIGSALYQDIFTFAKREKISRITLEVYSFPPNLRSLAFHDHLGFKTVGERKIEESGKTLAMQQICLSS